MSTVGNERRHRSGVLGEGGRRGREVGQRACKVRAARYRSLPARSARNSVYVNECVRKMFTRYDGEGGGRRGVVQQTPAPCDARRRNVPPGV